MKKALQHIIHQPTHIAPLAMFRVLFGFMMVVSVVRFWVHGWIADLYIEPVFHFTYYGFGWVKPLGSVGMYSIFTIMALSAFMVMLGLCYRFAIITFFLTFTYVELIDKTTYLNHYYFVSLVSFLMIWLPAHRFFSLDVWRKPSLKIEQVPAWTINILKFQLGIVYFYAGLAKLNIDWLFHALPLKIWLPAHTHLPIIGELFNYSLTAYLFSWGGAIYDLTIVFFLLYHRTRIFAYIAVVGFHLMTYWLFQIGMFPFIMIASTLIFFSAKVHLRGIVFLEKKVFNRLHSFILPLNPPPKGEVALVPPLEGARGRNSKGKVNPVPSVAHDFNHGRTPKLITYCLTAYILLQTLLPFRYALYPNNLYWTEEGYRFSWRVMLMEKAGYVTFHITDPDTGRTGEATNSDYLTAFQQKQMATQPDMLLEFAHFLKKEYQKQGIESPEVRAESYVTLNGRGSHLFINPNVDLTKEKDSFRHKDWVLPYPYEQVTKKAAPQNITLGSKQKCVFL